MSKAKKTKRSGSSSSMAIAGSIAPSSTFNMSTVAMTHREVAGSTMPSNQQTINTHATKTLHHPVICK